MPGKRKTYGLIACTQYSLRICDRYNVLAKPCEYHQAIDEAKARGISLQALVDYRSKNDGKRQS